MGCRSVPHRVTAHLICPCVSHACTVLTSHCTYMTYKLIIENKTKTKWVGKPHFHPPPSPVTPSHRPESPYGVICCHPRASLSAAQHRCAPDDLFKYSLSGKRLHFAFVYFKPHFLRYDLHKLKIIPFCYVVPCLKDTNSPGSVAKINMESSPVQPHSTHFFAINLWSPFYYCGHAYENATSVPLPAAICGLILSLGIG